MSLSQNYYKRCIAPNCKNSTKNSPEKLFFTTPINQKLRKLWLKAMHIELHRFSPKTRLNVCEDHFDLPNDLENYSKFLIGKYIYSKHHLKCNTVPKKFEFQNQNKSKPRVTSINRERKKMVSKILEQSAEEIIDHDEIIINDASTLCSIDITTPDEDSQCNFTPIMPSDEGRNNKELMQSNIEIARRDIGSQCKITSKKRSRANQTSHTFFTRDVSLSPIIFENTNT